MRILVQVVKQAKVVIEEKEVSSIGNGALLFVSFTNGDNENIIDKMIQKFQKLRIYPDENGMTNLNIQQVDGQVMVVSQFTLYADVSKGNRPSFTSCLKADEARNLYEIFLSKMKEVFPLMQSGVFQADMKVHLINDGPFTIWLDSKELSYE